MSATRMPSSFLVLDQVKMFMSLLRFTLLVFDRPLRPCFLHGIPSMRGLKAASMSARNFTAEAPAVGPCEGGRDEDEDKEEDEELWMKVQGV